MRKIKMSLVVIVLLTVTISCDKHPITIKPVLIAEGDIFAGDAGNFVIKTQAEWDNLICYRSQFYGDSVVCRHSIDINFDMFQIIAVIDGIRPKGGWSINITSIREYSDDIIVSIYIKGGGVTDELTQPYQIVKIPVTAKDVVFKYINFIPPLDLGEDIL